MDVSAIAYALFVASNFQAPREHSGESDRSVDVRLSGDHLKLVLGQACTANDVIAQCATLYSRKWL